MASRAIAVIKRQLEQIGIGTDFIFRPQGIRERNFYPNFDDLYTNMIALQSPATVFIDLQNLPSKAISLSLSEYDFKNIALIGLGQEPNSTYKEIIFSNNANFINYFKSVQNLEIIHTNVSQPVTTYNASNLYTELEFINVHLQNEGSQNIFEITGSIDVTWKTTNFEIELGTTTKEAIKINSGSNLNLFGYNDFKIDPLSFEGAGGVDLRAKTWDSSIDAIQPNFTGSFNILRLMDQSNLDTAFMLVDNSLFINQFGQVQGLLNVIKTVDPTINDDLSAGYNRFSKWINSVSGQMKECIDPSNGAAIWVTSGIP